MPISNAAIAGGGLALSAINKILGGKKIGPGMIDPRKFKKDIVLDEGDLATTRQTAGRRATASAQTAANRIAGISAAGRAPASTAQKQLKGLSQRVAAGVAQNEGNLREAQRQSKLDFMDQQQRFAAAKEGAVRAAQPLNLTGEIGMATRMALLLQSGLADEMDSDAGSAGGGIGAGASGVGGINPMLMGG